MQDLQAAYRSTDPYVNFKFRVQWDNRYVPGMSEVGPLQQTTEIVDYRDGVDSSSSRKSPGRNKYEAITLERGVTQDQAFYNWAQQVRQSGGGVGGQSGPQDFRKDILIELMNDGGEVVLVFKVKGCWPSGYAAFTELSGEASGVAIERITLENEGWERNVPAGAAGPQK